MAPYLHGKLITSMQKNNTSFARLSIIIATGFQLLACSSPSSSDQVTHDDRAYFPKLNDSTAMAAVFTLVMDTAYIGAGPNHGEVSEVTPRWLWTAKFDSVMARYPMADISNANAKPVRVLYTVESADKSDSLYKVNYTAEIAELQTTEGTLGTNSGTSVFRKNEKGWYLVNSIYNSHLSEELAASDRQNKLIKSLAKERAATPESSAPTAELSPQDKTVTVPNPAFEVSKLRYPIVVTEERGERYNNDAVYPAFVTFSGEVVDIDKTTQMSVSTGNLYYILERTGNGSSVPAYKTDNTTFKPTANVIKKEYHPYTNHLPEHTWTLYDVSNEPITSYKDFPVTPSGGNNSFQGSEIFPIGKNRFWISGGNAGNSYLINEKGNRLASFAAGLNSFAPPLVFTNDIYVLNHNTVIDRNRNILYQNDKFIIDYIIDDYVLLGREFVGENSKRNTKILPNEDYAYINYRSRKVIYRGGDHEKKQ